MAIADYKILVEKVIEASLVAVEIYINRKFNIGKRLFQFDAECLGDFIESS